MRAGVVAVTMLSAIGMLCWSASATAEEDYSKYPGFVDFSTLLPDNEPEETAEVFLSEGLMAMAAAMFHGEDPELSDVINKLKLIRVVTYSLDAKDWDRVVAETARIAKMLEEDKWVLLVRVREQTKHAHIYVKYNDSAITGLVVMSMETDEAAFINIVGEIDLQQIGRLGKKFHIDPLDSALKDLRYTPPVPGPDGDSR